MSSGDIADLAASVEAAEAACGGDKDCMVARLMPKSKRLRDQGKLVIPAQMPRGNAPEFERFLVIGADCPRAVATLTANDRYDELLIEAKEGGSGLRPHRYTVAGSSTVRGGQGMRITAASPRCSTRRPIATACKCRSGRGWRRPTPAMVAARRRFPGTGGVAALTQRLDGMTRWLEPPAGHDGKAMSGRRELQNVNNADAKNTAIRAIVEWKIVLD